MSAVSRVLVCKVVPWSVCCVCRAERSRWVSVSPCDQVLVVGSHSPEVIYFLIILVMVKMLIIMQQ